MDKKIAKIYVDRDLCIGAASCVAIAPGVFALDDENKSDRRRQRDDTFGRAILPDQSDYFIRRAGKPNLPLIPITNLLRIYELEN